MEVAHSTVALQAKTRVEAETPIGLIDETQPLAMVEEHLVLRGSTEGHEDVVLVVQQVVIGRRHDVTCHLEGEVAHRELKRTVLFLVQRIGELMSGVPVIALRTVCSITAPEEVRVECRHRTSCETQTDAVHIVLGDVGVDRSEVKLALLAIGATAHLYIVLHQSLDAEDDPLEALGVLHAMDETIHRRLALGQIHLTIFVPISLITVHGIYVVPHLRLTLEEYLRQFVEGIVGKSGVPDHQEVLQHTVGMQLSHHIVLGEYPLTIVELGIFLLYLHVLHPVYVRLVRDGEVTLLHMQGTVCQHIQFASETEVLRVGRDELEVIAEVTLHIDGVLQIEVVEGDSRSADRRRERILEQAHIVVIDIDIGENFLQGGVENFTRLDHLSDTIALLTLDDILLGLRVLAIHVLRHGLVDADRQGELAIVRRGLHLVEEVLTLAEELVFELFLLQVVECQRYLLVLIVLIIIMIGEVGLFLGSDDTAHQFHGRVFLAGVLATLGLHHHLGKLMTVVLELHLYKMGLVGHLHSLRLVAQCTHGEHPSRMLVDGKLTLAITRHSYLMPTVLHAGIRYSESVLVDDTTRDFLLRHHLHRTEREHQECKEHEYLLFTILHYNLFKNNTLLYIMCKDAVAPPSFKFGCKDTSFYPKRDENYYKYLVFSLNFRVYSYI